ncbi:tRNA preQ1(34) S-adenosylmethionine ribosyltransferase-isomerase QueA [bacterium]|nr:tRNA preQ1(34) S-adenosylmethionine ribosyltransferase-isomerase QueA [bacterium]
MKLSDFDYNLPSELIAQYPSPSREDSRLIIFRRGRGDISETRFANILRYLQPGDLFVINDSKVIPARIFGRKVTGARIEIFLIRQIGNRSWTALLRPSKRVKEGDKILVGQDGDEARIVREIGEGKWEIRLSDRIPEWDFIELHGDIPLPPYIKRESEEIDRGRYQTVYASSKGSVAAPTAGLHFTEEILKKIQKKGCTVLSLTLHVGAGTFLPLRDEIVENNKLSYEYIKIRKKVWDEIKLAKKDKRRVIAVGTTTTRVLESLASGAIDDRREETIDGEVWISGSTSLFIRPGFKFRIADALVTNLHLPRSSLFLLVSAFAGRENMIRVYEWAVKRKVRFYSYGDAMFIQ